MIVSIMNDERKQTQIKITLEAEQELEGMRADLGMTKIELHSRVVMWFSEQPDLVRKLILGIVPDDLLSSARKLLDEQVRGLTKPRKTA